MAHIKVMPVSDYVSSGTLNVTAPTIEAGIEQVYAFLLKMHHTPVQRFYAATAKMHYWRYYEVNAEGKARRKADRKR